MEPNTPDEKAIAFLRKNPETADKFDSFYGEGASAQVLSEDTPEEPEELNMDELVASDVAAAVERGAGPLADAAGIVGHGVQEAANETLDALESADVAMSRKLDEAGIPSRIQIVNKDGEFDPRLKTMAESEGDNDWLGGKTTETGDAAEIDIAREPLSSAGQMASSMVQFAAGFAGASKITGVRGVVGGFLNGAISDATVFDPDDPNLSRMMEDNALAVPLLTEALATDPESPEWANRMRNATEGMILGGVTELTMKTMRAISLARKARDTGDETLARQAEELADEAALEAEDISENGVPQRPEEAPRQDPEGDTAPDAEGVTPEEAPSGPASLVNEKAMRDALADRDAVTPEQLSESLWFNTEKMDGPVDAQVMIEVAGDALSRSGALSKLGLDAPETHASLIKQSSEELARITGTGLDAFTARVAKVSESAQEQAKFLVTGKVALQSIGREVASMSKKLDAAYASGKIDPEQEAKLLDLLETHSNLQGHLKSVQTAAARATSAGRIRTGDGLDAQAVGALERVSAAGGSEALRKAARRLQLAADPEQQAEMIRQMNRGGRLKRGIHVVNEVFINSILSGYGTHAVNMVSNTANLLVLPAERAVGGLLTRSPSQARQGIRQYAELRSATMDSIRLAGRVMRTEEPVLDAQVKLDYQNEGGRAIQAETFGVKNAPGAAIINGVGKFIRMPGRALMAEDEFFKQMVFRSRLQSNLFVTASEMTPAQLKKAGYANADEFIRGESEKATHSIQALAERWDELVLKGRAKDTPEGRERFISENIGAANEGSKYGKDALRAARSATFTTPLEKGTVSRWWQDGANRHPILRQITPFIQTPVNILNKAFDRTPGINVMRQQYRDRLRSEDPSVRAEAAGEMATGVAITSALVMLAHEGRISGGGPTDHRKRSVWMRDKGWQPYSINTGTAEEPNWIAFNRMDPYAFPFGIAGDVSEMLQASRSDPSMDTGGMTAMIFASLANNLTSKTWLQGVADVVEVMNAKDNPYKVQQFLETRAASLIPYSSAGRSFNQAMDDTMKEASGYIDRIKANTPGMSEDLPDRYDWLTGESVEAPTKLLGFLQVSAADGDKVSTELRELNYGFTGADRKIGQIELSNQQYQEWNRLIGSVTIGGRTLHSALEREMNRSRYDLDREKVPDGIVAPGESHRVNMLRPVISAFKQKARSELFEQFPELDKAWRDYREYQNRAESGRATEGERENLLLRF